MERYVILVDSIIEGTRDTLRDATQFTNIQLSKNPYSEIMLAKVITSYGSVKNEKK